MATKHRGRLDRPAGPLFDLYERYVGEPRARKDVYGYWTFLAGYALALSGVATYLVGTSTGARAFLVREVSITLSAGGLALVLFGFGLMLPVRRRGIYLNGLGLVVALGAVGAFAAGYPQRWIAGSDYSGAVITAYTVGVAVVAGVAALVPVLTGEKGWLVGDLEARTGAPPVLVGETTRGALFSVYQVGTGRWTWRVLQQDAVGENDRGPHRRPDVEADVEAARDLIGDAGVLDIATAAVRFYRADDGQWGWTLLRDDGRAVATTGEGHPDRDAAAAAASLLKEAGPGAPVVDTRGAAFEVHEADGEWHWRLLDEAREPLATSAVAFRDADGAEVAVEAARERFTDARVIAIDELGVELYEDGEWRWRVVDAAGEVTLTSAGGFESRRAAESAAEDVLGAVGSAPLLEPGRSAFELFDTPDGWRFRLVDAEGHRVADAGRAFVDEASARREAERMVETVEHADVHQYEDASFELYPDEGGWRWRLLADDRQVTVDSTEAYPDRAAAERAATEFRERVLVADLTEFEHAAIRRYESGGRWRLVDADGTVLADSGDDYESRDEAGDAMATLKAHAPDADILDIGTAAFELFEDASGWGWRLIDETGAMVARGSDRHPSRSAAASAIDTLVDRADAAAVRELASPAFQLYTDDDDAWRWRYVLPAGHIAAEGGRVHATRDEAVEAVAVAREAAAGAAIHAIDPLAFEVRDGGRLRVRLIDADRAVVAEGTRRYGDRATLETVLSKLRTHAPAAAPFAVGDSAVWLAPSDGAWQWALIDGDRRALAVAPASATDRAAAEAAAERAIALAPDAVTVASDGAAFEVYRDGDHRWRLVDVGGGVVATAADGFETHADARAAVDDVKALVGDASLLETDEAAFELRRDDRGWRWRLVDARGTSLVRSVKPHSSRAEARAAVQSLKACAPKGRITVVD